MNQIITQRREDAPKNTGAVRMEKAIKTKKITKMKLCFLNTFKRTFKHLRQFYERVLGIFLLLINGAAFANADNPFPDIDVGSGDVIKVGGSFMEKTLKYALIGGGGMLILISIAVLVHRLREDNREKDHTNLVTTFILVALGATFGFVLIAIGWKAFSADIS